MFTVMKPTELNLQFMREANLKHEIHNLHSTMNSTFLTKNFFSPKVGNSNIS